MKFSCVKETLLSALSIAIRALANKANTPILTGLYLKAKDGDLEIQANNNEIGIVTHLEADVEDQGELVLPGKYLQEVTRRLPGEKVYFNFSPENGIVSITSEGVKFSLKNLNASEFPLINRLEGNTSFTLPNHSLIKLVKRTGYSCAGGDAGEARPIFTGCFLTVEEGKIVMVATNTHRLAVEREQPGNPIEELNLIIPVKVLNELVGIIDSEVPVDVRITCTESKISFECENTYIVSRLIEGKFPEYKRVFPKSIATTAVISSKEFADAINRISFIAKTSNSNIIKLEFIAERDPSEALTNTDDEYEADSTVREGKVHISSTNPEIGNADESVPLKLTGRDVNISFNVNYLIDVMKVIEGDTCTLGLNKPLEPIVVQDSDDEEFTYILTPVRTSN